MKIRLWILIFFGVLAFYQSSAYAARFTSAYLLEICARDAAGQEVMVGGSAACQSYIAGLIDYHNLVDSLGTSPSVDFCVPEDVHMNDVQDIVWRYLSSHAMDDPFIAAPSVALALFESYPCE